MADFNFNRVRQCTNNPNDFCYLCAKYIKKSKKKTKRAYPVDNNSTKKVILNCFPNFVFNGINSEWAPESCCQKCISALRRAAPPYSWPAVWTRPNETHSNCFFCLTEIHQFNRVQSSSFQYPVRSCVDLPVPRLVSNEPNPLDQPDEQPANQEVDQPDFDASFRSNDSRPIPNNFDQSFHTGMFQVRKKVKISECMLHLGSPTIGRTPKKSKRKIVRLNQKQLNDLIRILMLTKLLAELLASFLAQHGLLEEGVKVTYFRDRDKEIHHLFGQNTLGAFMKDVKGFFSYVNLSIGEHIGQWRIFIDSSMSSLKAVLLHNGSVYPEIPIFFSKSLAEGYDTMKYLLETINYKQLGDKYKFKICADFKVINILRGLQPGNISYPCIYCLWNSRKKDHQYGGVQQSRETDQRATRSKQRASTETFNVIHEPLVDLSNILLPPLHIGLGLFSQLIKSVFRRRARDEDEETLYELNYEQLIEADDRENELLMQHLYDEEDLSEEEDEDSDDDLDELMFEGAGPAVEPVNLKGRNIDDHELNRRIREAFPDLHVDCYELVKFIMKTFKPKTEAKLEQGVFNGPEIRRLIQDRDRFEVTMPPNFKKAWSSYVLLCENFLGSERSEDYKDIVKELIDNYKAQGCLMSIKLHYLSEHLDKFPANCGLMSEQQGERFHQQLNWIERIYNKCTDGLRMLADYCWLLKSETDWSLLSRKPKRRSFNL